MADTNTGGRPRKLLRLLTEQSLIVNILGGVSVLAISALIGKAAHLVGHIGYAPVLIVLGVATALTCGLLPLIRYRRLLNTRQFASVATLIVAGSSLTIAVAGYELSRDSSSSLTVSCQVPQRVGLTLSKYDLRVCDCIDGKGIREQDSALPYAVETVSCESSHDAEVFFSDSLWTPDTPYPGTSKENADADAQCQRKFARYVGQSYDHSALQFAWWDPGSDQWTQHHDRLVVCAAYSPLKRLDRSVRGSHS